MASKIESKLQNLHIDLPRNVGTKPSQSKQEPLDSWEDDEDDSLASTPTERARAGSLKVSSSSNPALHPPPPTPISPKHGDKYIDWSPAQVLGGGRPKPYSPPTPSTPQSESDRERRRPEKTNAVANRMIAHDLGVRMPKKTDEQRQYDRAVREQEMKRRNREKEEKERAKDEDEKARAAVWHD